jgi:putative PIN family toxin of toxin-antitoxin system
MQYSISLRVLIDCSTFYSGIFYPLGKPHKILALLLDKAYRIYLTEEILEEYKKKVQEIARRMEQDPKKAKKWFRLLEKDAFMIKSQSIPKNSCRDPNDLIYLEAAAAAEANYLVSSDKDLLVLGKFQKTKILTPAQFLEKVKSI